MDCGPTCFQMIAKYNGRYCSLTTLRRYCHVNRGGISLMGISDAAEAIGFRSMGVQIDLNILLEEQPVPLIAHWNQNNFVVVYKIEKGKVWVADPSHGKVTYTQDEFMKSWASSFQDDKQVGIFLLMEPTPDFFNHEDERLDKKDFSFLFQYLKPYKKFIIQLILGLFVGSLLQLLFPFLTQAVIDIGINTQNISFIYIILAAQLMIFISRMSVEFIHSWIMLHISTSINISLISDFLIKLMKLPIRFFDSKLIGDLIQRIEDHSFIESFLTEQILSILFSMVNLLLFGVVLAYYSISIFTVFLVGRNIL